MDNINSSLLQAYLPKNILKKTNLTTTIKHEVSFIEPDYQSLMHDFLLSVEIDSRIAYVHVTLDFNEFSKQLREIILTDCINRVKAWHYQRHDITIEDKKNDPFIFSLPFSCDKKPIV